MSKHQKCIEFDSNWNKRDNFIVPIDQILIFALVSIERLICLFSIWNETKIKINKNSYFNMFPSQE